MENLAHNNEQGWESNPHVRLLRSLIHEDDSVQAVETYFTHPIWPAWDDLTVGSHNPTLEDIVSTEDTQKLAITIVQAVAETSFRFVCSLDDGWGFFVENVEQVTSALESAKDKGMLGVEDVVLKNFFKKAGFSMSREDFVRVSQDFDNLPANPEKLLAIIEAIDKQTDDFGDLGHPTRGFWSIGWFDYEETNEQTPTIDLIDHDTAMVVRAIKSELGILAWIHDEPAEQFQPHPKSEEAIVNHFEHFKKMKMLEWLVDDDFKSKEDIARHFEHFKKMSEWAVGDELWENAFRTDFSPSGGIAKDSYLDFLITELVNDFDALESFMDANSHLLSRSEKEFLSTNDQIESILESKFGGYM